MNWLIPALLGCIVGAALRVIIDRRIQRRERKRLWDFVQRNRDV